MKISVILPTYLHLEDCLRPCIESIKKYTDLTDIEIIVVANGPNDGTREYVWQQGDPFIYLGFAEPIGYTRACNEGIKIAKGDYIVLLNNDTELLPQSKNQWLDMLTFPFVDPKVGITGPMCEISRHINRYFAIFFCVMIPKRVLDDVGLLDEAFNPGFCEDNDWCARAEIKGYRVEQVPSVRPGGFPIWHKGNRTFNLVDQSGRGVYSAGYAKNIELLKSKYPTTKTETIDGYMPSHELDLLKEFAKDHSKILEIGSWHGKSTRALAENTKGVVYAVDTWYGSDNEPQNHGSAYLLKGDHAIMEFYRNNFDLISSGKIMPIRMHSANACDTLKKLGVKFDMVFIDGDHTYEGCKSDIVNTKDLMEEGALVCGHDYAAWVGVKQAVDELLPEVKVTHTIWQKHLNSTRKVFDCFLFFNELELLDIRLNELADVVDEFILIESNITTTGKPKPLYFTENKEKFAKFLPKIRCVVLDDLPMTGDTWVKERYARDKFKELVKGKSGDVVMITDIDEIPAAAAVKLYNPSMGLRCFDQALYYYWLNCYNAQWDWAKIIGYDEFMKMTPCQIRYTNCKKLDGPGGWHFSFQGGVDRIIEKIQAWTHSEYNRPEIVNAAWIEEAINTPKDVLRRANVPMKFVPIDSTYPKYIVDNIDKFKSWIK